jgi:hypothetical protein
MVYNKSIREDMHMAITLKTRAVRERVRQKYVRSYTRSAAQEIKNRRQIQRSAERGVRLKPEQQRLKEQEKQKLLSEIQKEKHPDKLREKMELAKQQNLKTEQLQKDKERLEKMEKARERLKESIKKMNSHEASANTKEAVQDIQAGRSETAVKKLKEAGHDGALGNDIAHESAVFAKEAKRAPQFFIKLNIEWLYRLMKNPSRIGRVMALPKFAIAVIKAGKRGNKNA